MLLKLKRLKRSKNKSSYKTKNKRKCKYKHHRSKPKISIVKKSKLKELKELKNVKIHKIKVKIYDEKVNINNNTYNYNGGGCGNEKNLEFLQERLKKKTEKLKKLDEELSKRSQESLDLSLSLTESVEEKIRPKSNIELGSRGKEYFQFGKPGCGAPLSSPIIDQENVMNYRRSFDGNHQRCNKRIFNDDESKPSFKRFRFDLLCPEEKERILQKQMKQKKFKEELKKQIASKRERKRKLNRDSCDEYDEFPIGNFGRMKRKRKFVNNDIEPRNVNNKEDCQTNYFPRIKQRFNQDKIGNDSNKSKGGKLFVSRSDQNINKYCDNLPQLPKQRSENDVKNVSWKCEYENLRDHIFEERKELRDMLSGLMDNLKQERLSRRNHLLSHFKHFTYNGNGQNNERNIDLEKSLESDSIFLPIRYEKELISEHQFV